MIEQKTTIEIYNEIFDELDNKTDIYKTVREFNNRLDKVWVDLEELKKRIEQRIKELK